MKTLTTRQTEELTFCADFAAENERPPTRSEIASYFGFKSANAAECHLKALARKGALFIASGTARGITLA